MKISESRKRYLRENPDKHPWKRNDKFKSVPCEHLKQFLRDRNINFVEEFQPLAHRGYAIDIAFPDRKLGIEVNGNQHYERDGSLKTYYQQRHELIESAGWKLIQLHYSSCFKPDEIQSVLTMEATPDYSEYYKQKKITRIREKRTKPQRKRIRRTRADHRKSYLERNRPIVDALIASEIDLTKHGSKTKAAKIIGISPQKVNQWLRINLQPDDLRLLIGDGCVSCRRSPKQAGAGSSPASRT